MFTSFRETFRSLETLYTSYLEKFAKSLIMDRYILLTQIRSLTKIKKFWQFGL